MNTFMKNGLLKGDNMTLKRYGEILRETGEGNVFGMVYYNINDTNDKYYLEFPHSTFMLFKRENDTIKTGFNTIMLLKGYDLEYFSKISSRADGIIQIEEGDLEDLKLLRGQWVKEALS